MSVAIALDGDRLYRHTGLGRAPPGVQREAAAVDGAAEAPRPRGDDRDQGVRHRARSAPTGCSTGDLWIVGHGDPEIDARDMAELARAMARDGPRTGARSRVRRHRAVRPRLVGARLARLLPSLLHRAADGAHVPLQRAGRRAPRPRSRTARGEGAHEEARGPRRRRHRKAGSGAPPGGLESRSRRCESDPLGRSCAA